jgi:2-haloacid dehalogenase
MTDGSVQAVVFDLGGVLIDWDPRYLYRRILDHEEEIEVFLSTVCTPEWNAELDRGRSFEEMVELLCSKHPERRDEIVAYHLRWDEMLGESFEGSVRILEELHSAGYPLYALTNWSAETFHIARERYGFLSLFEEIIVSGEAGLIKPDPRIYELLVERTGLDPYRAVFVDDREENVRAAKKRGFTGVLFQGPRRLRRDLSRLRLLSGHGAYPPPAEQQDHEDEVRARPIGAGHDSESGRRT